MTDPTIRRADARFVLPEHPTTAVAHDDPTWQRALELAAIPRPRDGAAPDLVAGRGSDARALIDHGASMILLEGSTSTRVLRAAGYEVTDYVSVPDAARPELIVPSAHRAAARYALRRRTAAAPLARRVVAPLVGGGVPGVARLARPAARLTLASKVGLRPRALDDVEHLGVPPDAAWFLHLGRHDQLAGRRMAFLAFAPGAAAPSWALKLARLPGEDDSFERDRRGVDQLRAGAAAFAHRAPRPIAFGWTGEFQLSVETAAVGDRVTELLRRRGTKGLPLAHAIASWLTDVAVASRSEHQDLDAELARLRAEVLPFWEDAVDGETLLAAIGTTPAVLLHGDPGTWNMMASGVEFSVIDWESARPGLPLWDLLYFLADASAQMARQTASGTRDQFLARLFRGDETLSALVFEQVRRLADVFSLDPSEVGALATLCWLHYSTPAVSGLDSSTEWYLMRFARHWLTDPALGPTWSAWQ